MHFIECPYHILFFKIQYLVGNGLLKIYRNFLLEDMENKCHLMGYNEICSLVRVRALELENLLNLNIALMGRWC